DLRESNDSDDVAGLGRLDLGSAELVKNEHAVDRAGNADVARFQENGFLPAFGASGHDPADGDPADILGEIQRGAQHAEWTVWIDERPGNVRDDHVEKGPHVALRGAGVM